MLKEPKGNDQWREALVVVDMQSQMHTYLVVNNYNNQWLQLSIISTNWPHMEIRKGVIIPNQNWELIL